MVRWILRFEAISEVGMFFMVIVVHLSWRRSGLLGLVVVAVRVV